MTWMQYCADAVARAAITAPPIYSFIRECRKHLGWSRWKARPAGRRWSGFAAATWTTSFFTNRIAGRRRKRAEALADAIEEFERQRLADARAAAPRQRRQNAMPGRASSSDCFAFTARSAQTTDERDAMKTDEPFTIRSYRAVRSRGGASALLPRPDFSANRSIRFTKIDELFADFLTTYYTDHEPESSFVLEMRGRDSAVTCSDRASRFCNQLYSFQQNVVLFLRALLRYPRYNERSRRFIRWMLMNGWREVPAAPRRTPHFHINLLPDARKMSTTRALDQRVSELSLSVRRKTRLRPDRDLRKPARRKDVRALRVPRHEPRRDHEV